MDENKDRKTEIPEKKKKKLFDLKNKKTVQLIIAAVLGLVVLGIFLSTLGLGTASEKTERTGEVTAKQLESILSKIEGAGKVSIVITYKDAGSTVYAKDEVKTSETVYEDGKTVETVNEKNTVVLVGGKPLIEKVLAPEVMGVVIVAQGAKNAAVRLELIKAAETLLNIKSDLIKVFSMTS